MLLSSIRCETATEMKLVTYKLNIAGAGLLKLHDDVQMCGYQDVQVMWEMLQRSESELNGHNHENHPKRNKQRPFWSVFVWSNNSTTDPSFSANHA
ncbi:hypothetical protein L484_004412 [Morus notabilis]|uniref:Uncharacterized protein n=1 Tax=Morus notabilis TaxID=981085 RepID=W9S6U2_9ROSA|nr:hypothetical protein L484_004412 [Morus notabilis]